MANTATASGHDAVTPAPVYVFEAPVRIWHWLHALCICTLCVTGYLIANPLPAMHGDATEHFIMGYMRLVHLIAAYMFAIGFVVRLYWALVGNRHAREMFIPAIWKLGWWRGFFRQSAFYLFLTRKHDEHLGHNPLAQTAYCLFNFILVVFMILTGFALHGEALGVDSWADRWFGWVTPLMGDSMNVKMWHQLGMWLMVVFMIIHIYMVVRAEIMMRQSSISTIFSGWRFYK